MEDVSKRVRKLCEYFNHYNPDPQIELYYRNEYTLLIAIMLSAQTTDKNTNKVTRVLFECVDNPRDMLEMGIDRLKSYIKSIGLYNSKAKNIMAMSEIIVKQFHGNVPHNFEELIMLPGVGRKTANVFLNTALGLDCIGVDRHVHRVCGRLGISFAKTTAGVERDLVAVVPKEYLGKMHHWLVLHGRYVCVALRPKCGECIISTLCPTYKIDSGV